MCGPVVGVAPGDTEGTHVGVCDAGIAAVHDGVEGRVEASNVAFLRDSTAHETVDVRLNVSAAAARTEIVELENKSGDCLLQIQNMAV